MIIYHISALILLIIFLLFRKPSRRHERINIIQLICALLQLIGAYFHKEGDLSNPYILFVICIRLTFLTCHGPLFYLYHRSKNEKKETLTNYILLFFPAILHLSYLIFLMCTNQSYIVELCNSDMIYTSILYLSAKIYFLLTFPVFTYLCKAKFSIKSWSGINSILFVSIYVLSSFSGLILRRLDFYFYFPIFLYLLVLIALTHPHLFYRKKELRKVIHHINTHCTEDIEDKILEFTEFMQENKPFLNKELTFSLLAEQLDISKSLLTRILHNGIKLSFPEVINNYRLDYFISIYSQSIHTMDLLSIAKLSGFPSKTTFYRVFRSRYNCSPKKYFKNQGITEMKSLHKSVV